MTNPKPVDMKAQFETQVCSRCHGSGKYSFCEMYRDTCFKCSGLGVCLTKRGSEAQRFFRESCLIPISQLKVGDVIRVEGITHGGKSYVYEAPVVEISRSKNETSGSNGNVPFRYFPLQIKTQHAKHGSGGISAPDEHTVRVYRPDDSVRLQEALDYQATLTKSGTVRKKKAQGASPLPAAPRTTTEGKKDFTCCGGSDEHPKNHTQDCPDRLDEWKVKAGKLANGFERGKGTMAHLVKKDSYAGAALCGEKPAVQWTTSENPRRHCLKCSGLRE